MACDIKVKGSKLTPQQLNNYLQAVGNNPIVRDAIIFDNYIRLTADESEVSPTVLTFLQQQFNLGNVNDVWDSVKREQVRREQLGILDLKGNSRQTMAINNAKDIPAKVADFFKRQFSSKGKFYIFGKKTARHAHNLNVRRENLVRAKVSEAFRIQQRLNIAMSKLDKFLDPADRIALSNPFRGADFDSLPLVTLRQNPTKLQSAKNMLEPIIQEGRQKIAELQQALADSKLPNEVQAELIRDTKGEYTTRLYEVHRNPDYASKFEKDSKGNFRGGDMAKSIFENASKQIRNIVSRYLTVTNRKLAKNQKALSTYLQTVNTNNLSAQEKTIIDNFQDKITRLQNEVNYYNEVLTNDEALRIHVVNFLQDVFKNGTGSLVPDLGVGNERGAIGRSILMKRNKDLSPEIRALLGEIREPQKVYMSTVTKITSAYANSLFQENLFNMNDGFLQDYLQGLQRGNVKDLPRPIFSTSPIPEAELTKKVKLTDSMSVLRGLVGSDYIFTHPDFAEDTFENIPQIIDAATGFWRALNTAFKMNVTIFSFVTSLGNFLSNITKLASVAVTTKNKKQFFGTLLWSLYERTKQELSRVKNLPYGALPDSYSSDYERFQHTVQAQGLENSDVVIADIQKDLKDQQKFLDSMDDATNVVGVKHAKDFGKLIYGLFKRTYAGGDNVVKEALFIHELNEYSNALHDMNYDDLVASQTITPEEKRKVENLAGEAVRRTFQNYNETYEVVKTLQKSAFTFMFAPFISFTAEMYRTTWETVQLAKEEISDTNPKVRSMGWRRLVSLGALAGFSSTALIQQLIAAFSDDEEDEDVTSFTKKYELFPKGMGAPVVTTDPETGYIKVFDFAQRNVAGNLSMLDGIYRDVAAGVPYEKSLWNFVKRSFESFFTRQGGTGALIDVFQGLDEFGNPLYNESDTVKEKTYKVLGRLLQGFTPGTVSTLMRNSKKADAVIEQENNLEDFRNSLPILPSEKQQDQLALEEEELAKRNYDLKEDNEALSSLRQQIFDPNTKLPAYVWDRIKMSKESREIYTQRVEEKAADYKDKKLTKRDREEIYDEINEAYQKNLKEIKDYYQDAQDLGYNVDRLFTYGQQTGKEKFRKDIKSPFSKEELKYIKGEDSTPPSLSIKEHDSRMNLE